MRTLSELKKEVVSIRKTEKKLKKEVIELYHHSVKNLCEKIKSSTILNGDGTELPLSVMLNGAYSTIEGNSQYLVSDILFKENKLYDTENDDVYDIKDMSLSVVILIINDVISLTKNIEDTVNDNCIFN